MTINTGTNSLRLALLGTLIAGVASANASIYEIRKSDVIPVKFDTQLSTNNNIVGDTFTARVEANGPFPDGTKFDGHIVHLQHKSRHHPAAMDLAFDDVRLPNGDRYDINGVPIPLSDKYVDRGRDGRYVAKPSVDRNAAVGLGFVGGFIVGALLHRPFEGAFIGTLAGIAVSATASNGDEVLTINQDSEAGVLFKRDVRIDTYSASTPPSPINDSPPVVGSVGLSVRIGDKTVQYTSDLPPYREGAVTMVPIAETAKQLGLNYDEADSSIFVENDAHSLRFEQNSLDYRFDGQSNRLGSATVKRNGVWYAPSEAFKGAIGH